MDSSSTKETAAERNCVLCCMELDIFALGKCDHPVCYRCSTKMRVLCEQKYCAVCREELDKVVFVNQLNAFSSLPYQQFQCEKNYDIYFGDANIYAQFRGFCQRPSQGLSVFYGLELLLPECPNCPEPKVFSKYEELEQHMRKQHELFCCKLCTKHLKIFCHERKWYNRKDLARHRTQGDPDDTSHRGHPLCKFCDDRYLDNDELLKHLRRDHYFCHFCDADGAQEYYCDYQYLSEHFRERHYLCEEGRCATEQFTHAFRTEIDYKAHKAQVHSKNRAEARQNRHIDLQFTYAPRQQQQRRNEAMVTGEDYEEVRQARGGRAPRAQGGQQKSWRYNREEEDRDVAAAMRASMAVRRMEERGATMQDMRGAAAKHRKEERHERLERPDRTERHERITERHERTERPDNRTESEESRHRTGLIKPMPEPPVRTMRSSNPLDEDRDFPALGGKAAPPTPRTARTMKDSDPRDEEDDFPALGGRKAAQPPMPRTMKTMMDGNPRGEEDDFPALGGRKAAQPPMPRTMKTMMDGNPRDEEDDFPALGGRKAAQPPMPRTVRTMKDSHPMDEEDPFPALGGKSAPPMPSLKPGPTAAKATHQGGGALKEDDFPSLSAAVSALSSPMTPAYSAQPRNASSFQEEDFPALVSKIRPLKPSVSNRSAWSAHHAAAATTTTSSTKVVVLPPHPSSSGRNNQAPPSSSAPSAAPPALSSGPQPLSSSSSSSSMSSRRKKRTTAAHSPPPSDNESGGGLTQQEFRAVPTMLDISSLLTTKGGGQQPPSSTKTPNPSSSPSPNPAAAAKASKKKNQQQQQQQKTAVTAAANETRAQKENVPERASKAPSAAAVAAPPASAGSVGGVSEITNGFSEKPSPPRSKKAAKVPAKSPDPSPPPEEEEEEFPALISKKPPPGLGFKSTFPLKASPSPASCTTMPPPPPGLGSAPSKPPPGFTGIPLNSNVIEPVLNSTPQVVHVYLVPENFQQRNMELIQSIKDYLHNDESQFNQFKNFSGQFRQGVISAAQYHRSCKDLLGLDNFNRIFNELLVLLPDTNKQQELLTAHGDSKALEKQSGGGGKKNKNKKSAWQTATTPAAANAAAAELLDCQVCPTCRQVLSLKDFNSHKTLHMGQNEDFPSLQSISRIIS